MPNRVYWDSCVFIEVLQRGNPERFDVCRELIAKAEKNNLVIVTSAVTIAEVNKIHDGKPGDPSREEQSRRILDFFGNPYIRIKMLDRATAEMAHGLTRTHSMKPLDAIHAATAALGKVEVLYTYDGKRGRRGGLLANHLKIGNPPLRIELPPTPSAGPLFGGPSPGGSP
jgi:predicted nucleic acid-binding protein